MAFQPLSGLRAAQTFISSGLLKPLPPQDIARIVGSLRRWGTTIAGAYSMRAKVRPDDIALADDQGILSFKEIDERTNSLACNLDKLGLLPQDKVGILCANGRGFVELSLACAKLGCDRVPINTTLAAPQLKAVTESQSLKCLAYDAELAPQVEEATSGLQNLIRIAVAPLEEEGIPGDALFSEMTQDTLREGPEPPENPSKTVILTSGTTGAPKGALRTQTGSLGQLLDFLQVVPRKEGGICHIAVPCYHLLGYSQLEISAALGSTLVLTSKFEPAKMLELVERHKVTELIAVPIMLKRILDLPESSLGRYDTESLDLVLSSGSSLSNSIAKPFIDRFGQLLYNLYGATELAWATVASPEDLIKAPGTIGKPVPGTRVEVLDSDNEPLGPEEKGTLFVGNELLFSGYTDRKSKRPSVRGMMSVGDLGHYDCDGFFYVDAREDDMIISGGENIYPNEVEQVLMAHPDVSDAAVIGVADDEWGQALKAFVVSRPQSELSEEILRNFVKSELAGYKAPRAVVFIDSLPRNAIGKVLKKELS